LIPWIFIKIIVMSSLVLRACPTLADYQEHVKVLELQRGFSDQSVIEKCLLLGEEVGELFKAVRKAQRLKMDANSNVGSVKEELADIMIYLCAIANRLNIDLEQAFREKEAVNMKRQWV